MSKDNHTDPSLSNIKTITGPGYEIGFPRPVGALCRFLSDEVDTYVCMTKKLHDEMYDRAVNKE